MMSWRSRAGGGASWVREPMCTEDRSGVFCGASDVEKTAVGRASGPGDGAERGRAPGAGSELRGWCIVSNLPRAPGLLRAHPISTPASDGAPERARRPFTRRNRSPCVRTVCETVMQPRTINTVRNVVEQQVRDEAYTVQRPVYRTVPREVQYTVQRPVTRTVWKDVTYTVCRPVRETHLETRSYTVCRPVRETSFKTCAYNVCQPVREVSYKDVCYTVCRPVQETVLEDGQLHGLPARPGDLLQDVRLHGLPAGSIACSTRCVPYTVQVPVQQTVMQCQPATEMVPVRQCAYKQVPYTVCRQMRETLLQECRYTVQVPVKRTEMRTCTYTVCRPVRETVTAGVPLHGLQARPDDHLQDGQSKTCYQTVTETAYREDVRDGLRAQDRDEAGLPHRQRGRRRALLMCRARRSASTAAWYECPGTWCETTGLLPADGHRERLLHGLRVAGRPQAGPGDRLQAGAVHGLRAGPGHDLPVGRPGMRQAGPGDHLPDGERDLRQAGARDRLRVRDARSASSRCP